MNRTDLINQIAETTGSYKCEVEKFVQAYEEAIIESLRQNKKIHLHGFLDLFVKESDEKKYKNPRTGKESVLPATKKVKVSVSKKLSRII